MTPDRSLQALAVALALAGALAVGACAGSDDGRKDPAPTTGLATTSCQPRSAMRSARSRRSPTPSHAVGTTGTPCLASCRRYPLWVFHWTTSTGLNSRVAVPACTAQARNSTR